MEIIKIGKNLAKCCNLPNSPQFFPTNVFYCMAYKGVGVKKIIIEKELEKMTDCQNIRVDCNIRVTVKATEEDWQN